MAVARTRRAPLALLLALLALARAAAAADVGSCKDLLQSSSKSKFKYCAIITAGKAALLWKPAGKGGADVQLRLVVNVPVQTDLGWLGLGFSDMGSMAGSDLIIFHTNDASEWTATDAHAKMPGRPVMDKSQDVTFIGMAFDAATGNWAADVARKMKTCDLNDDMEIQGGRGFNVMWAYGKRFANGFDGIIKHDQATHGFRALELFPVSAKQKADARKQMGPPLKIPKPANGASAAAAGGGAALASAAVGDEAPVEQLPVEEVAAVVAREMASGYDRGPKCIGDACAGAGGGGGGASLAAAAAPAPAPGGKTPDQMKYPVTKNADGSYTATIACASPIPGDTVTTYMTCYVELPTDNTYQVTSYTTVYGHHLVHHSLVYACSKEQAEPKVQALFDAGTPGPFNQKDHPQVCESFYMVGQAPIDPTYTFPKGTGLPIGKDWYRYVAIEVHYNNVNLEQNQTDPGTGLTIVFALKSPKVKDVGILTNSQFVLDIAPGVPQFFANESVCHGECTKRFSQDVTMIGQFVHMHGLGRAVHTRRHRFDVKGQKWVELEPLLTVNGFDYAFQTWIDFPDAYKTLKRGDQLSMQCIFDSTARSKTTHWGFSTQEEMCFWWIYYYPAQRGFDLCSSLGDANVMVCAPDGRDLLDIKPFADAGNMTGIVEIITRMKNQKRAFLLAPASAAPADSWDPEKGCSSDKPPAPTTSG